MAIPYLLDIQNIRQLNEIILEINLSVLSKLLRRCGTVTNKHILIT